MSHNTIRMIITLTALVCSRHRRCQLASLQCTAQQTLQLIAALALTMQIEEVGKSVDVS